MQKSTSKSGDLLVSAVLIDPVNESVLLVYDPPGRSLKRLRKMPGGKNDAGESAIDAICRKIAAETGLIVAAGQLEEVLKIKRENGNRQRYQHIIFKAEMPLGDLKETKSGHVPRKVPLRELFRLKDVVRMHMDVLLELRKMGVI